MGIKPNKKKFLGQNRRNVLRFQRKQIIAGMKEVYGHDDNVGEWADDAEWKYLTEFLNDEWSTMLNRDE